MISCKKIFIDRVVKYMIELLDNARETLEKSSESRQSKDLSENIIVRYNEDLLEFLQYKLLE